ncbi:MAG: signal recognition particle-docking protein FtsY [Dermabacter sp.]|nr:signal recognition particle-docking protein FtsY [Dermabacter sp.]
MDLTDILTAVAAGGGGIAVIAAGLIALTRGKKKGGERDRTRPAGTPGTPAGPSSTRPAGRPRPPAPSWGDSLSGPAEAPDEARAPGEPTGGERGEEPDAQAGPADDAPVQADDASAPSAAAAADAAPEAPIDTEPTTGTEAPTTVEAPAAVDTPAEPAEADAADLEVPEATADRMVRLRERLQRSGSIGRGILALLSSGAIDQNTWDEVEETLLLADLGPDATDELLDALRARVQVLGTRDPDALREVLRDELVQLVNPELDRRIAASAVHAPDGTAVPSVIMMVGVNGTGKTTTTGKFGRVLIAEGRSVLFGAADTFRAAAADQLQTWGERVGVTTVRSDRDGADPASVAFDAVARGIDEGVDVVIIDTAGRLQNKKGLMDELGKVRRVASKALRGADIQEVILVLDATTGQNGMQQARVFAEAVNVTGLALTKLDGTAKGGIVVNVQRELGVPVKLVGLGEGMDDLTPFDPYGFVDALLE